MPTTKTKAKYRDEPRYKAIRGYEDEMKKNYKKTLTDMTAGLINIMGKHMSKNKQI